MAKIFAIIWSRYLSMAEHGLCHREKIFMCIMPHWHEPFLPNDDVIKWKIFSALLAICVGNSPVTGEFPAQRPVTRSFDVFIDLPPNKRLSKQSWGWWSETPSISLWRHCNAWLEKVSYSHREPWYHRDHIVCFMVISGGEPRRKSMFSTNSNGWK